MNCPKNPLCSLSSSLPTTTPAPSSLWSFYYLHSFCPFQNVVKLESRVYSCLWLASFTLQYTFKVLSCFFHGLITFLSCGMIFHGLDVLQLIYPFTFWKTSCLLPKLLQLWIKLWINSINISVQVLCCLKFSTPLNKYQGVQ